MTTQSERSHKQITCWGMLLLALGCSGATTENGGSSGSPELAEGGSGSAGRPSDGGAKGAERGGSKGQPESGGHGGGNAGNTALGGSGDSAGWAGNEGEFADGGSGGWGASAQGGAQGGTYYTGGLGGSGGSPVDGALLCADGYWSGWETDIDCGGPHCAACPPASSCTQHGDCKSRVCRAMICQSPSCEDEVKNGSEAGVDCGGSCEPCP
jgi:hypothetical protein